jgi:choline/glycine/proline betaine transport protein
MAFSGEDSAEDYLEAVAVPVLREVAGELCGQDLDAQVRRSADDLVEGGAELTVDPGGDHPFHYRLRLRSVRIPDHGRRARADEDTYSRLEVQVGEAAPGYDVLGYTYTQLIDDVLDQYERHLELLRLQEPIPALRRPSAERPVRD